jgi:NAD(P)-dependent dehydrogenase (short-subunit alcohol dehydrogenase family)
MHVAVIEPGAVATPIWDKSRQSTDELEAGLPERAREHYGAAVVAMRKITERLGARGVAPERVAVAVEHALTAERPRTRYVIGNEARIQIALRTFLPDRAADAVIARAMGL